MNSLSVFSSTDELDFNNSDILILFKGSEDRSYNILKKHIKTISNCEIILFDSRIKQESLNAAEMEKYNSVNELFEDKDTLSVTTVSVEDTSLGKHLNTFDITKDSVVSIDISSMNFWEYSDLIYYFLKIIGVKELNILYTEPNLYHYESNDISQYNHKEQKVSINYVKSYYSTKTDEDEILVSLIGFQKNVNKLLKDIYEVAEYYSINGFPSFYPKAKDISQTNNSDYLSEIEVSNRFSSEAINPFLTYNTLVDISKASNNSYMNICPLCSKPMAVGACLYILKHPNNSRIIYPYKETVLTKSDGIGDSHCYTITQDFI